MTRILALVTTAVFLGATLTQPTANDLNLDLPAAIQGVEEPPVVMRIGVVTDIVEADNITVRISGSPVLVTASYLFPQYAPIQGDRVVVYRQDSQWFVVGTMSGPNNTALLNPGFELGNVGSAPTNWTVGGGSTTAGVPTLTKQPANNPVDGNFVAEAHLPIIGPGTSFLSLTSARVPVSPGERWTGGFFWKSEAFFGNYISVQWGIGWYDSTGAAVSFDFFGDFLTNSITQWYLQRPDTIGLLNPSYVAPAGAVSASLEIAISFEVPAATPVIIDSYLRLDRMILRRVS